MSITILLLKGQVTLADHPWSAIFVKLNKISVFSWILAGRNTMQVPMMFVA
jgi:hypothetical protein